MSRFLLIEAATLLDLARIALKAGNTARADRHFMRARRLADLAEALAI